MHRASPAGARCKSGSHRIGDPPRYLMIATGVGAGLADAAREGNGGRCSEARSLGPRPGPELDQPVEGVGYPRSPGGLACARVRAIGRGRRSRARPNPPPARHDRREGVGYALRSLPRACARARDRKVVGVRHGGRSARPGSRSRLGTRCPASTVGFEPRGCDRPGFGGGRVFLDSVGGDVVVAPEQVVGVVERLHLAQARPGVGVEEAACVGRLHDEVRVSPTW